MSKSWQDTIFDNLRTFFMSLPMVCFYFCSFYAIYDAETMNKKVECFCGLGICFIVNHFFLLKFLLIFLIKLTIYMFDIEYTKKYCNV